VARVIFHVDMDAFYVSVERRENPDLVGKPVIVGADPKGGRGRGVVMAASYEARQLGVRSGMPISMAWHKLPQATYLRPNYDLYAAASESVIDVLRSHADILEHVSIDEAFLDVTSKVKGFDDAADYALRVKAAVKERERLACTIGVGPNKSVAKMASDLAKPDGLKIVRPEEVNAFLDPLPVTRISGVGAKTAAMLERVGVRTIGELARFPGAELKKLMGKNSVWLWAIARGSRNCPSRSGPIRSRSASNGRSTRTSRTGPGSNRRFGMWPTTSSSELGPRERRSARSASRFGSRDSRPICGSGLSPPTCSMRRSSRMCASSSRKSSPKAITGSASSGFGSRSCSGRGRGSPS